MNGSRRSGMFWVVWGSALALAVLHQDVWFWGDVTLVLGVVPVGLFYHACFSVACAMVWALAVKFAWPQHLEAWADEFEGPARTRGGRGGGA
ncbi:MAG: hypothetical protein KJZ68_13885 [Phycisphaerales bacterium]|nr:hypothetical protein [Phycisphaerales bacterium]